MDAVLRERKGEKKGLVDGKRENGCMDGVREGKSDRERKKKVPMGEGGENKGYGGEGRKREKLKVEEA